VFFCIRFAQFIKFIRLLYQIGASVVDDPNEGPVASARASTDKK